MGLKGREKPMPRVVLMNVFVIVLVLSSALSKKTEETKDIKKLKCGRGEHLLIRRTTFENSSLCPCDGKRYQQNNASLGLVDCFGLCLKNFKPRFTLQLLREVYAYVDAQDDAVLENIKGKLKPLGQYKVYYDCIDSRKHTVNPCAWSVHERENTLFFVSSGRDKTPCRRSCTLIVFQHGNEEKHEWEHQFLLKEGAPEDSSKVSYQIDRDPKSLNWRRLNQTHLVNETLPPRKTFTVNMKFWIENELEVSRIWIKFPYANVNVRCQKATETTTTTTPALAKTTTHTRPPHKRKNKLYLTLLVIPAVLTFLAVVICVVLLILKRSETRRSRAAERRGILNVALGEVPRKPSPSQLRHSYFSNQAFTDSFNDSHPAPASSAFPPLMGNGSDHRRYDTVRHQYGTLDYHGTENRQREAEDDYNHIPIQGGMEAEGYETFQRNRGAQIVIDNTYNHTHTS